MTEFNLRLPDFILVPQISSMVHSLYFQYVFLETPYVVNVMYFGPLMFTKMYFLILLTPLTNLIFTVKRFSSW